jgi:hypothetical protein
MGCQNEAIKVSTSRVELNFFGHILTDTVTDHITPLRACARGNNIPIPMTREIQVQFSALLALT